MKRTALRAKDEEGNSTLRYRTELFDTKCERFDYEHTLFAMHVGNRTSRTECGSSYFRYKCEKVILSSWGRLRASEARVEREHQDKITFSLVYRTQYFYTTCTKLDLAHAFLFERAQNRTLRTECKKMHSRTASNILRTSCVKYYFIVYIIVNNMGPIMK